MTPDDTARLFRYWRKNPPAHIILAAVHTKPKRNAREHSNPQNAPSEAELVASGLLKINRPKKNA
jgi:hypothetical protein